MQTLNLRPHSMQTTPPLKPRIPALTTPSPAPPEPNTTTPTPAANPAPPTQTNPATFADLFKENRNLAKCVALDQDVLCEDGDTVVALEEDLLTIEEAFGHSLLGCVVGGSAFPRAIRVLIKSWDVECTYSSHANGWIVFRFGTKVEKERVLRNGPYSVLGKQWLIKDVPKLFSFKDSCFSSIPIWINLRFLPKQCWSKVLLSRIARKIGKPIAMDVVTGDKTKHDGARILVEVDLSRPIVEKVSILMPDGRLWDQGVDYEIKPVLCKTCKGLGHDDCKGAEPSNNVHPRRRSRSRVRWNLQRDNQKGEANILKLGPNAPRGEGEGGSSSILSAPPNEKGKGKVDEGVMTELGGTQAEVVPKDWQMVTTPMPSKSRLAPTFSGAKDSCSRIMEGIDGTLQVSPNMFAPLFEEDERTTPDIREGEVDMEESVAKNPRVRVGKDVKEEDLRRSGRRRRANSSSS